MNTKFRILVIVSASSFVVTSILPFYDKESHIAEELRGIEDIKGFVVSGINDSTSVVYWDHFNL